MAGYRLGIKCSFCGGSLEIDEASHTTRCSHCGSALKIVRPEGLQQYRISDSLSKREVKFFIERYLKECNQGLVSRWGELTRVYIPFWRVQGTTIVVRESPPDYNSMYQTADTMEDAFDTSPKLDVKISTREITFCADESVGWGITSLGVRSQVVKLEPLDRSFIEENTVIPPSMDSTSASERFGSTVQSTATASSRLGAEVDATSVGIESSMIFFPIWLAIFANREGEYTIQFDPLAKRVASMLPGEISLPTGSAGQFEFEGAITVIPHRCPNCGTDLPENEGSSVYYCENCRRLFAEGGTDYRSVDLRVPAGMGSAETLFPLWVFSLADCTGDGLGRLMTSLTRLRYGTDKFVVPAFDISNPSRLMRLISHYNYNSHQFSFESQPLSRYNFQKVAVSPRQAASFIVPLISAIEVNKGFRLDDVRNPGTIGFSDPELIWMPFELDNYFWRDSITGASIEKAAVKI